MTNEPESLILQMLRDMRREIGDIRGDMASKSDIAEVRSEIRSLRADVASDFHELDNKVEKLDGKIERQTAGLRRQLVEYHTSVIGHGIIISELEARVRRVEQHLNLPPAETH